MTAQTISTVALELESLHASRAPPFSTTTHSRPSRKALSSRSDVTEHSETAFQKHALTCAMEFALITDN